MQSILGAIDYILGPSTSELNSSTTVVPATTIVAAQTRMNTASAESSAVTPRHISVQNLEEGLGNENVKVPENDHSSSSDDDDDDDDYNKYDSRAIINRFGHRSLFIADDDEDDEEGFHNLSSIREDKNGFLSGYTPTLEEHRKQMYSDEDEDKITTDDDDDDDEGSRDDEQSSDVENYDRVRLNTKKAERFRAKLKERLQEELGNIPDEGDANKLSATRILVRQYKSSNELDSFSKDIESIGYEESDNEEDLRASIFGDSTNNNGVNMAQYQKIPFSFNIARYIDCLIDNDENSILNRLASLLKKKQVGGKATSVILTKKFDIPRSPSHLLRESISAVNDHPSLLSSQSQQQQNPSGNTITNERSAQYEYILNNIAGLKKLYQVQQVYLDPSKEFDDSHIAILSENLVELCLSLRDSQPTLKQLMDRFIIIEGSPKLVQAEIECSLDIDIGQIQSHLLENDTFPFFLDSTEIGKKLSQFDKVWPVRAKITARDSLCNFAESFEVLMPFTILQSEYHGKAERMYSVKCEPMSIPIVKKRNQLRVGDSVISSDGIVGAAPVESLYSLHVFTGGNMTPSSFYQITDQSLRCDIVRTPLWALYVVGVKPEKLCEWMTPCNKNVKEDDHLDKILWKRNIVTFIILQTLVESRAIAPQSICQIADHTIQSGTLSEFVMTRVHFESIIEYVRPHLVPFTPDLLRLSVRPLNRHWDRVRTESKQNARLKFYLSLYLRCFKSSSQVVQVIQEHSEKKTSLPQRLFDTTQTTSGKSTNDPDAFITPLPIQPRTIQSSSPSTHLPTTSSYPAIDISKIGQALGISNKPKNY